MGDFQDVEIIEVHIQAGDRVEIDNPLITLESDKATMDVPAPFSGKVENVLIKVGDKVSEGNIFLEVVFSFLVSYYVARDRIELPTRGFSVHCSTD